MTESQSDHNLFIILASRDPEAARNMAFMYAKNSMLRNWWDRVRLIVWGPSAEVMASDPEIQAELPELFEAGVEVWACKACADRYGVSGTLQKFGLDVFHVGESVTEMLQSGWKSLTV